jgi:ubiquinone/menaquinone biosynthesis C-methylase UbiE
MTTQTKDYKGLPMEGPIARWYAKNAVRGRQAEFERAAQAVTANLPAGTAILEVAPGPGYLSIVLARGGRYRVSGLDISRTFVEIERKNAREAGVQVDFHLGSASQMPFGDEQFERVVCQAAFKNFTRPVDALNEMRRVLRPGGQAVIFDLNSETSDADINREVAGMGLNTLNAAFTRLTFKLMLKKSAYNPARFTALVARSEFKTCEIQSEGIGMAVWLKK